MLYRKNMGSKESRARVIGGALIVACSLTQIGLTPDMYREMILLRDMEQLTIAEAADRLRITREACKSRIHRGRALLREYLQGDESRGGKK